MGVAERYGKLKRWARRYGLRTGELAILLDEHESKCWVCRTAQGTCIDHHHGTKVLRDAVRGILCNRCNVVVGVLEAHFGTVGRSAIAYIERGPGVANKIKAEQTSAAELRLEEAMEQHMKEIASATVSR